MSLCQQLQKTQQTHNTCPLSTQLVLCKVMHTTVKKIQEIILLILQCPDFLLKYTFNAQKETLSTWLRSEVLVENALRFLMPSV
jgi:hypothetical protein